MADHECQPHPRPRYRRRRLARPAGLAPPLVCHPEGRLGPRSRRRVGARVLPETRIHGSAARTARSLCRAARILRDQGAGRPARGVRVLLVREGFRHRPRRAGPGRCLAPAHGGPRLRGDQPGTSSHRLSARPDGVGRAFRRDRLFGGAGRLQTRSGFLYQCPGAHGRHRRAVDPVRRRQGQQRRRRAHGRLARHALSRSRKPRKGAGRWG